MKAQLAAGEFNYYAWLVPYIGFAGKGNNSFISVCPAAQMTGPGGLLGNQTYSINPYLGKVGTGYSSPVYPFLKLGRIKRASEVMISADAGESVRLKQRELYLVSLCFYQCLADCP
jgi:hypothetical protein